VAIAGSWQKAMEDKQFCQLIFSRSRIAKKSVRKISVAREIVEKEARRDQRWLIYCEDRDQMDQLALVLRGLDLDLQVMPYHSKMDPAQLEETLSVFSAVGGVLVSIRCLDEGVDLPDASHALVLASSKNPRQFVQRRGRVLRKPREGADKLFATIYDILVVPRSTDDDQLDSLTHGEIGRAHEFCKSAQNSESKVELLKQLHEYGLDLEFCTRVMEDEPVSIPEEEGGQP